MNYKRIYNEIIENAQSQCRHRTAYWTDCHHINPRSLGGDDDPGNLVLLTPREHFVCHWLLTKMHDGQAHHKMLNALRMMKAENKYQNRYKTKITARVYENIRYEYSKLQSKKMLGEGNSFYGKTHTEKAKQKISEANKGREQPDSEKAKQVAAQTGRKRAEFSDEWKANLSKASSGKNNSRYGVVVSEETKRKIGDKIRGTKQSAETIAKKIAASTGTTRKKKLCPHCGRDIAVNTYPRWHGDNCKQQT